MYPPGVQHDVATIYETYRAMYKQQETSASSASASTSTVPSGPDAPQGAPKPRKANRLPEEALCILRDYYYNKKTRPSAAEKRELLARIHQIPGTEWYSMNSINSWFGGRQQIDREKKRKESESRKKEKGGTASILWPTLDADKIESLRTLYEERPASVPLSKLAVTWARALGANVEHVRAWLDYHDPSEETSQLVDRKPTPHLPTPEATASPEPSHKRTTESPAVNTAPQAPPVVQPFSTISPVLKQQQFSPTQPTFIPSRYQYLQDQRPQHVPVVQPVLQLEQQAIQAPASPSSPPPAYSPPTNAVVHPRPELKLAIADAAPPPPAPVVLPEPPGDLANHLAAQLNMPMPVSPLPREATITSIEDIDAAFAPYEAMMRDLLDKAQCGHFMSLGLHPALVLHTLRGVAPGDVEMDVSA